MTKQRAVLIVSLALTLIFLHVLGLWLQFYWRIGWYDRVVHMLAGAIVVLVVFSLTAFQRAFPGTLSSFMAALLASLVIGVLWEFFELKAGITSFADVGYTLDTTWDIACDVIGGVLALGFLFLT